MLTTDDLARLRDALRECVTGTFVHRDELETLLRVYEAVLAAPEGLDGPAFARWKVRLVPLATAKPTGCGARLAPGQHWAFCGETDMGQTGPALCTKCGGAFIPLATAKGGEHG